MLHGACCVEEPLGRSEAVLSPKPLLGVEKQLEILFNTILQTMKVNLYLDKKRIPIRTRRQLSSLPFPFPFL